jgi:hypothetical protein
MALGLEGYLVAVHSYSPLFGRPGFKIQRKGFLGKAGIGPILAKTIGQIKSKATLGFLH